MQFYSHSFCFIFLLQSLSSIFLFLFFYFLLPWNQQKQTEHQKHQTHTNTIRDEWMKWRDTGSFHCVESAWVYDWVWFTWPVWDEEYEQQGLTGYARSAIPWGSLGTGVPWSVSLLPATSVNGVSASLVYSYGTTKHSNTQYINPYRAFVGVIIVC